jgi:outer membrane protein assembly factor BamB
MTLSDAAMRLALLLLCVMFIALPTVANEPRAFTKCWEYSSAPDLSFAPVADASNIYFVDREGRVNAVDIKTGSKAWTSEIGGSVISNFVVTDSSLLVATLTQSTSEAGSGKTVVRSISKQTGITLWQESVRGLESATLGSLAGNVVIVGSDGAIVALSTEGRILWQKELGSAVTSVPNFGDRYVLLASDKNELAQIAGSDGSVDILRKMDFRVASVLFDHQRGLVVGDERGNLIALDLDGDERWRFRNGARIGSIMLYDSEYIATSNDNFVYKLGRSGNVEWKRRLPGRLAGTLIIFGDTAVASIVGTGSIFVLDLKNGKIFDRFETGEEASAGVAASAAADGFGVTSSEKLYYFSRTSCRQQKDGAESAPSSKKS